MEEFGFYVYGVIVFSVVEIKRVREIGVIRLRVGVRVMVVVAVKLFVVGLWIERLVRGVFDGLFFIILEFNRGFRIFGW